MSFSRDGKRKGTRRSLFPHGKSHEFLMAETNFYRQNRPVDV
ncbi:hypothetical protein Acin_2409 [Acidaminococcus intestini RyC-MR95]|uniref:Uncharacterized protein n=1 Tax=Acidaminococcus intestini (strain RyC-MR95) TaxID=568816 RepID=G4Q7T1_ACIIR|nr:hypothetical protein Acin_2409 [Acidaminococcus intestini RyC-MR95]